MNDLHAFVARLADAPQLPNNVHFTEKGYDPLAEDVAEKVAAALPKKR